MIFDIRLHWAKRLCPSSCRRPFSCRDDNAASVSSIEIAGEEARHRHEFDAFIAKLGRFLRRCIAPNSTSRNLFVMDPARTFCKSMADVLRAQDDAAQELQRP